MSGNVTLMAVEITVRGVPEVVRDELAARAGQAGLSLEDYLLAQLVEMASQPSPQEQRAGALYYKSLGD